MAHLHLHSDPCSGFGLGRITHLGYRRELRFLPRDRIDLRPPRTERPIWTRNANLIRVR